MYVSGKPASMPISGVFSLGYHDPVYDETGGQGAATPANDSTPLLLAIIALLLFSQS